LKKIFIISILLVASVYSHDNTKIYMGTSYGYANENFSVSGYDSVSSQTANIKIGYGIRDSYAVEFSLDYTQKDKNIFSAKDGDRYGLNLEIMKAFDWDIYINPFLRGGFGAGYLDIENSTNKTLSYSSYNLSAGCFIPVNEHFDFEIGYRYKYTSYEKIQDTDKKLNSNINIGYIGVNVRF